MAPLLTLRLLGGFRVERADLGPLPERWRRPGARTVVKVLALAPGHRLHRDQVTDACWPDADVLTARRSLRVSLHTARHTLEPELPPRGRSSYLTTDGELLALVPGTIWVDVVQAEEDAAAALTTSDAEALDASWRLLSQDLLPEDRYADWAANRRRELSALRRRVAAALGDAHTVAGRPGRAVEILEQTVTAEEVDEALHRRLLAAYLASGDRTRAIDHYRRLQRLLEKELGTAPEPETQALVRRAMGFPASQSQPGAGTAGRSGPVLPAAVRRAATTPLRGRDRTLAAALARISPKREAAAPLTVVSGESGAGKTRLVAEAARAAADRGMTVLWGAAHEAEGPLPYGAFGDALSGWLAGLEPAEREVVAAGHPGLGALLPELGTEPPRSGAAEEEWVRLFRAVCALLVELSAERPVLLVVDDLHAADLGTLRLLHHLVRTVGDRPVRFLATLREEGLEEGDERRSVLRAAGRQGLVHRIELMRLARTDCYLLAGDVARTRPGAAGRAIELDPELLDTVYRLSRGNPLFVTELVRAVAESAAAPESDHASLPGFRGGVPESVREVVFTRVAHFAPQVRQALEVLAVAGGEASLSEAAEVALCGLHPPLPGPVFAAALDTLTAARLVDECEVVQFGRRRAGLTFRHPVVGLAVYERLSAARRRQMHLAYASAVRRHRPEAVDALAHHLDRADDPEAVVWLRRAAERAASLYADDSAARYYADLVARLDAASDGPNAAAEAARVRLDWAEVLIRQARHAEAEEVLSTAADALGRAGDTDGQIRAKALLAETMARAGRPHQGIALLLGSWAPVDEPGTGGPTTRLPVGARPEAVGAHHLALARIWFQLGHYDRALACADRAAAAGRAAASPPLRVLGQGLHIRAACLLLTGRLPAAREAAEQALPIAERAGDLSLQSRTLSTLRELSEAGGRLGEAADYARRTLAMAERTGDPIAIAFERANLARVDLMAGRLDTAREGAQSAVASARPFGPTWGLSYCLIILGEVELRAGQASQARRWLAEGSATARQVGDDQAERAARVLLAEVELLEGRPAEALAGLGRPAADEGPLDDRSFEAPGSALTVAAEALLALGKAAEAEQLAHRALDRVRAVGNRPGQVEARRVLGLALLASGQREKAEVQLRGALRLARAMGLRPAEERARQATPRS
ncbi:hypothetical protein A6A27_40260 [Micromonospora sp. CB01531]|nr:hypothetical protein A6A27_40260 [Micromonospora sp. CB01531]